MTLLERRRFLIAQSKKKSKNLFNASLIPNSTYITNNGDGSFTVQGGSLSRNTGIPLKQVCPDLKVGDVATLSAISTVSNKMIALVYSGGSTTWKFNNTKTITQNMLDGKIYFYITSKSTTNDYCTISNIQIELGTEATKYEPYY